MAEEFDSASRRLLDATRQPTPRTLLSDNQQQVHGVTYRNVVESVTTPTDWQFCELQHVFVIHRSGRLQSLEMEFEWGPSGQLIPEAGQVWVIPAQVRYAALAHGHTVEFTEIWFPTALLGGVSIAARVGFRDPFLYHASARLASVAHRDDTITQLLRDTIGEAISLHLRDQYGRPLRRPSSPREFDSAVGQRIVEYLETELDSEISLQRLATLADMSVATFTRAFVVAFGTTPYQFVLNRRIEKAKRLLATSTIPVSEIGTVVGFSSPSHFTTTFRRRVGLNPSRYRVSINR